VGGWGGRWGRQDCSSLIEKPSKNGSWEGLKKDKRGQTVYSIKCPLHKVRKISGNQGGGGGRGLKSSKREKGFQTTYELFNKKVGDHILRKAPYGLQGTRDVKENCGGKDANKGRKNTYYSRECKTIGQSIGAFGAYFYNCPKLQMTEGGRKRRRRGSTG